MSRLTSSVSCKAVAMVCSLYLLFNREAGTARALPLPACGERVGVRGCIRESERPRLVARSCPAPHPNPLPARGERERNRRAHLTLHYSPGTSARAALVPQLRP